MLRCCLTDITNVYKYERNERNNKGKEGKEKKRKAEGNKKKIGHYIEVKREGNTNHIRLGWATAHREEALPQPHSQQLKSKQESPR